MHGHLAGKNSKILVIDGARQIGKSYIIRDVAKSTVAGEKLRGTKDDTCIASGSLLVPAGSVIIKHMYQLDFEEFLWANGFTEEAVSVLEQKFLQREPLDESMHERMMDLFKKNLLVGGLPDAVNEYLSSRNIVAVRNIHETIHTLYGIDAAQYDEEHKLKIIRIYNMIPYLMGNNLYISP